MSLPSTKNDEPTHPTPKPPLEPLPEPHPGPQRMFVDSTADIAIYGGQAGGGKTWALLFSVLAHINNPDFGAVIFRRTSPQITNEGGLWDESFHLYGTLEAKPRHTLDWRFPSNANVGFRHLQYETDRLAWQGSQITMIGFDELTHFTESQFYFLLSRNRSTCGVKPYVRATTNPTPSDDPIGGWVNRLVSWWIDQKTGFAIPERSGVVRWFIRRQGELIWADTREALIHQYGNPELDPNDEHQPAQPKSVTFIHACLTDNPTLLQLDPGYRANLLALPEVERQQLAEGNWNARVRAGMFFKVGKIEIVDALPTELSFCRAWDLAATEGAGDWTVGAKLGVCKSKVFYIVDIQRGQWESSYRDQIIRQTAEMDGTSCAVQIPQDPAAAGKCEANRLVKMLCGYPAKPVVVSGSKDMRARGLASQMNVGNVKMLAGSWNHDLLHRLDAFPTKGVPDDEVDALADAFQELSEQKKQIVIGVSA